MGCLFLAALSVVITGTLGAPYLREYHIVSTHVVQHTLFKRSTSFHPAWHHHEGCHYLSLTHVDPDLDFCFKIHVEEDLRLVLMGKEGREEFKLPNTPEGALVKGYATTGVMNSSIVGYLHDGQFFGSLMVNGKDFGVDHIHTHEGYVTEGAPFPARRDHKAIVYRLDHIVQLDDQERVEEQTDDLRRSKRAALEKFGTFGNAAKEVVPFHGYNPMRTFHKKRDYPVVCRLVFMADNEYYRLVSGSEDSLLAFLKVVTYAVNIRYIFSHINYEPGRPNPGTRSDNIRFWIHDIVLFKDTEGYPIKKSPYDVTNNAQFYLQEFSMGLNLQEFCLGIVVSGHVFKRGPPGAAFVPTPKKMTGGICEETIWVGGRMMSRNLVVVSAAATATSLNPVKKTSTTIAYYMAMAMGAKNEKNNATCHPKDFAEKGYYLMYSDDLDGTRRNHWLLSGCSKMDMKNILMEKANCFLVGDTSYCGNGIIEEGEECDCGTKHVPFQCEGHTGCCELAMNPKECKVIIPERCLPDVRSCAMCGGWDLRSCDPEEIPCAEGRVPCIQWASRCMGADPCVGCNTDNGTFFRRDCEDSDEGRICNSTELPCMRFRMCDEGELPCFPCLRMSDEQCDDKLGEKKERTGLSYDRCRDGHQVPCHLRQACPPGAKSCIMCDMSDDRCRHQNGSLLEGYCDTDRLEPELPCLEERTCDPDEMPCVPWTVDPKVRNMCPEIVASQCLPNTLPCRLMDICPEDAVSCNGTDNNTGPYCYRNRQCTAKTEACKKGTVACFVTCPDGRKCTPTDLCGVTRKPCVSPRPCDNDTPCIMCGQPGYPECSYCESPLACRPGEVPCVPKRTCEDSHEHCKCRPGDETCRKVPGQDDADRYCETNEVSCYHRRKCTGNLGPCRMDGVPDDPECPGTDEECGVDEVPCRCMVPCGNHETPCVSCAPNTYPCMEPRQCEGDESGCVRCGRSGEPACVSEKCKSRCLDDACSCFRPNCTATCGTDCDLSCTTRSCMETCGDLRKMCEADCALDGCVQKCGVYHARCSKDCESKRESCIWACKLCVKVCDSSNTCSLEEVPCYPKPKCESGQAPETHGCVQVPVPCQMCNDTCIGRKRTDPDNPHEVNPHRCEPGVSSCEVNHNTGCQEQVACMGDTDPCVLCGYPGGEECKGGVDHCKLGELPCVRPRVCTNEDTPCHGDKCFQPGVETDRRCLKHEIPCVCPKACEGDETPCTPCRGHECRTAKNPCVPGQIPCVLARDCEYNEEPCCHKGAPDCDENYCGTAELPCLIRRQCEQDETPCVRCGDVYEPQCGDCNVTCKANQRPCRIRPMCEPGEVPCCDANDTSCMITGDACREDEVPCKYMPRECELGESPCKYVCPPGATDCVVCGRMKPCVEPRHCDPGEVPCILCGLEGQETCTNCSKPCDFGKFPCRRVRPCHRTKPCDKCRPSELPCQMTVACREGMIPCVQCGGSWREPDCDDVKPPQIPCNFSTLPCIPAVPCTYEYPCCDNPDKCKRKCDLGEVSCVMARRCGKELPCTKCNDPLSCSKIRHPEKPCRYDEVPCIQATPCKPDETPCVLCEKSSVECKNNSVECKNISVECKNNSVVCKNISVVCDNNSVVCDKNSVECDNVQDPKRPCWPHEIPCTVPEMCGEDPPCVYCSAPGKPVCKYRQKPCRGDQVPCLRATEINDSWKTFRDLVLTRFCEFGETPCLPCGDFDEPDCLDNPCKPNEVPCIRTTLRCQPDQMGSKKPKSRYQSQTSDDAIRVRPYGHHNSASALLGKTPGLCIVALVLLIRNEFFRVQCY